MDCDKSLVKQALMLLSALSPSVVVTVCVYDKVVLLCAEQAHMSC